jgi:capsular polysaccharide transport system permease protein
MATAATLLESFAIQTRVIKALMLREMITRFGRENLGALWMIGEPMMFTLGVAALWSITGGSHRPNLPVVAFAITGYSSMLMWRNTVSRCMGGLEQNRGLLYHRNVSVLDVFVTRILLEIGGTTASFTILTAAFAGLELMTVPPDLLTVAVGWSLLAWFGFALALFIGALATFSHLVERVWHPLSYVLVPVSGAGFMVDWWPPSAQAVVLIFPAVHGIEMVREGYFGGGIQTHYNIAYVATFNVGLTLAALFILRSAARRVGDQ